MKGKREKRSLVRSHRDTELGWVEANARGEREDKKSIERSERRVGWKTPAKRKTKGDFNLSMPMSRKDKFPLLNVEKNETSREMRREGSSTTLLHRGK